MSKSITTTKTREVTLLGVPVRRNDLRVAGAHGERVELTEWIEDQLPRGLAADVSPARAGDFVAIHCKGNDRNGTFERFAKETLSTREDAERWARARLDGTAA